MLSAGDPAPNFNAVDEKGHTFSLKDFRGKTVVLYFYPKDETTGCTAEACDFRDHLSAFKKAGAVIIGVSPDSIASHAKFKLKHDLPFALVSDESKEILEAYGVWQKKSMYGRSYMGVVRSTFVIGPTGNIAAVYEKVKVAGHVKELLKAVVG